MANRMAESYWGAWGVSQVPQVLQHRILLVPLRVQPGDASGTLPCGESKHPEQRHSTSVWLCATGPGLVCESACLSDADQIFLAPRPLRSFVSAGAGRQRQVCAFHWSQRGKALQNPGSDVFLPES